MTPDITEEGEDLTPPKRSRWYWALAQLPGFHGEQPPEVPDALVEAAQMESAFFASYMHEKSAFVTFRKRRQRIFWSMGNLSGRRAAPHGVRASRA